VVVHFDDPLVVATILAAALEAPPASLTAYPGAKVGTKKRNKNS